MSDLLQVLLLTTIPLSCIAILLSCVSIAIVVGLKNSTHRIEWKTFDPNKDEIGSEDDPITEEVEMVEENPNKRRTKNPPFTPFPTEPPEEEPFFDEDDPNNTAHNLE